MVERTTRAGQCAVAVKAPRLGRSKPRRGQAVPGAAEDGGYYLLGLRAS